MTVYIKELKESFFTKGDTLPYRTRQMVMGYFMDEESCRRDSEAERDFYTSKNHYSDLFSRGKTIYMNTTIDDRNHYTKMKYSWSPISLLEANHRGLNAEEFGADNCEGKKLKDSGYCNLNFDWSSSGLSRSCQTCGNEEFMDDYWDSQRISISEPEEGKILCSMTEFNGGRDENDLGYCSFDFNYGSGEAFSECDVCGTEVYATFNNSFYDDDDDDDDDDDEFEAEDWSYSKEYDNYYTSMNARTGTGFYGDVIVRGYGYDEKEGREIEKEIVGLSLFLRAKIREWIQDRTNRASNFKWSGRKGNRTISKISYGAEEFDAEGINLRKRIEDLIDIRELNFTGFKKDSKRDAAKRGRRIENEIKGVIPKGKSYKVDRPKWFKMVQTGIVMGVAGLVGYSGFKNKE